MKTNLNIIFNLSIINCILYIQKTLDGYVELLYNLAIIWFISSTFYKYITNRKLYDITLILKRLLCG